jgi:uncharacterized protein YdeI (YjbR/CyaY-like superfamily)
MNQETKRERLYFKDKGEWTSWLEKNHSSSNGVLLIFYKKHAGKKGVSYVEALEEAIRFGWIDSILRRIDDEKHSINFTPRKHSSVWSKKNKDTAERLIKENKMAPAGYAAIEEAKKRGLWDTAYTNKTKERMPTDLKKALMKNKLAWTNFCEYANTYRNMYVGWVKNAKTDETRMRRINEVVERSLLKKKPGIE